MKYATGTVTLTTGSANVTGTDTLWLGEDWLTDTTIPKFLAIPSLGRVYPVLRVVSDTSLKLGLLVGSLPGAVSPATFAYNISAEFGGVIGLPLPRADDTNKAALVNRALEMIDTAIEPLL